MFFGLRIFVTDTNAQCFVLTVTLATFQGFVHTCALVKIVKSKYRMSQSVDIAQSGAPAGERRQESQLIGSILETDADDGADLVRRPFFSNASAASAISRSMSAPPVVEV
jgi:hypothetical protein